MSTTQDKAADLLSRYLRTLWRNAGLGWDSDHDAEIGQVVGLIVSAAREELPALDRLCLPCGGTGARRHDSALNCDGCAGDGHVITDAGRQVIAFLQRHPASLTRVG